MPPTPAPTVGRMVHYVSRGSSDGRFKPEHRAAIVTRVPSRGRKLDLAVINPNGLFYDSAVPQDEHGKRGGTWHWPEREV